MQKCVVISELSIFVIGAECIEFPQAMRGPDGPALSLTRYRQCVDGESCFDADREAAIMGAQAG